MITSNISIPNNLIFDSTVTINSGLSVATEIIKTSGIITNDISTPSIAGIALINTGSGIVGPKGDPGGCTILKTAGENIGGHRVVILNDNDQITYASSFFLSHSGKVLGITKGAISQGNTGEIQTIDYMTEPSWNWEADKPIYLADNGLLTQDINNTGLFVLVIAYALSQISILINKNQPIIKG